MKKRNTSHRHAHVRPVTYPNAAEPGYFLNKFIDTVLSAAVGAGTFTILFFLMTM